MAGASRPAPRRGVAFVLLVAGFATKAGLVPLHVWLPRAHPEAPEPRLGGDERGDGQAGRLRRAAASTLRLLPGGPRVVGGRCCWCSALASALYGILQASVATDLKRLLAYSTTENIGLILIAIGVGAAAARLAGQAPVGRRRAGRRPAARGQPCRVQDGAVPRRRLGAARHRRARPRPARRAGAADAGHDGGVRGRRARRGRAAVTVRVRRRVGAAAGPHPRRRHGTTACSPSLLPVAVAVVALTAGLALLTFVKAFGIGFLARPRSAGAAAQATRPGRRCARRWCSGAVAVVGLGLVPGPRGRGPGRARSVPAGVEAVGAARGLTCPAVDALLDPVALTAARPALVAAARRRGARRLAAPARPRRDVDLAWGCGGVRVSPRMQYTATSFAEPLVRVFDDALQPEQRRRGHPRRRVALPGRAGAVPPAGRRPRRGPALPPGGPRLDRRRRAAARRLQNGSIHRYLGLLVHRPVVRPAGGDAGEPPRPSSLADRRAGRRRGRADPAAGRADAPGPGPAGGPGRGRVSASPGATCASCCAKEPLQRAGTSAGARPRPAGADGVQPRAVRPGPAGRHRRRCRWCPDDLFVVVSVLLLGHGGAGPARAGHPAPPSAAWAPAGR